MKVAEIFLLNSCGVAIVALLIWFFMKNKHQDPEKTPAQ
jgi:hypothetical protein